MKILAIETSCDETAISIIDGKGGLKSPRFSVLSSVVSSQIALHTEWGGVVPNIARREHQKNLLPVLLQVLEQADFLNDKYQNPNDKKISKIKLKKIQKYLEREPELLKLLLSTFHFPLSTPNIDAIAVTHGPGLEPALWVGVNFAKALSALWDLPLIPTNHMEGHISAVLLEEKPIRTNFPAIALLVSGGHTELVLAKSWGDYKIIGETQDDAVGEAFDKVARMLSLGYPGGPEISKLAKTGKRDAIPLPRPMISQTNFNFSFSGLKTAVLYYMRDNKKTDKADIAASFEEAAADVLISKTLRAAEKHKARSIIIGGGVAANTHLRNELKRRTKKRLPDISVFLPSPKLTTDNAAMIGAAAYISQKPKRPGNVVARANLRL